MAVVVLGGGGNAVEVLVSGTLVCGSEGGGSSDGLVSCPVEAVGLASKVRQVLEHGRVGEETGFVRHRRGPPCACKEGSSEAGVFPTGGEIIISGLALVTNVTVW